MNRADFLRGWLLLTTQPWGKAYRTMALVKGEPSPAEIQSEFYFKALHNTDASHWVKACEIHATGEHWPSIDVLKGTLRELMPAVTHVSSNLVWGPENITKDEFGQDLFRAIYCQAASKQCWHSAAQYDKREKSIRAKEEREKADAFVKELQGLLAKNTIAPSDVQRILAIP